LNKLDIVFEKRRVETLFFYLLTIFDRMSPHKIMRGYIKVNMYLIVQFHFQLYQESCVSGLPPSYYYGL